MRRITKFATAVVAGGALAVGGAAAALAAGGPGPGPGGQPAAGSQTMAGPGPQAGQRSGPRDDSGPIRATARDGTCLSVPAPSGTLTAQQRTTLAAMAEEEKLAHDLYAAFAARYDTAIFDRIAAAESNHLTAIRTLLTRYGIPDPTAGKGAGQFATATTQAEYDKLLAQGKASEQAALNVGVTVEKTDITSLRSALQDLTAADVQRVYTNLLTASERHLAAFQNWLER